MAAMTCANPECRAPFEGRSNRRYCCRPCKRHIEYLRRCWDNVARLPDIASGELLPGVKLTLEERRQQGTWNRELKANLGDRP